MERVHSLIKWRSIYDRQPAATRVLTNSELETVVGGTSSSDWASWIRPLVPPIPYPGRIRVLNKGPNGRSD
jgi:hypothetical protein